MSRRGGQGGFTLIEIVVALTLLGAVILMVTRVFMTVLSVTQRGGNLTVATALATRTLEELRSRVESQPTREDWRNAFCQDIANVPLDPAAPPRPFDPPYANYAYRVLVNEQAVRAAEGQQDALLPAWSVEQGASEPWSRAAAYVPSCEEDESLTHDDRLRWVRVLVYTRGEARPLVQMTTALVRGAYHR